MRYKDQYQVLFFFYSIKDSLLSKIYFLGFIPNQIKAVTTTLVPN